MDWSLIFDDRFKVIQALFKVPLFHGPDQDICQVSDRVGDSTFEINTLASSSFKGWSPYKYLFFIFNLLTPYTQIPLIGDQSSHTPKSRQNHLLISLLHSQPRASKS
jgi:hypothetical protein